MLNTYIASIKWEEIGSVIFYPYLFTYLLTYGAEPYLRRRQLCSHSRTSQHFMEPEGSIPYRTIELMDFIHRPVFKRRKQKNTTFRRLDLHLRCMGQDKSYSQGNGPIRHVETCPDFFFHCESTHNKIHCQNSSCTNLWYKLFRVQKNE
jgi:hypothetical protein